MTKSTCNLANTLRNLIAKSDLTVNRIALEAGMPQPVLHRFAKGERDLTLETAQKLIDYFEIEIRLRR